MFKHLQNVNRELPYTDALLALSDAPLAYFGCAILLEGQKNGLSRQIDCPFLPYTSSLPWFKGARKAVGGGQKRVRVRYVVKQSFYPRPVFVSSRSRSPGRPVVPLHPRACWSAEGHPWLQVYTCILIFFVPIIDVHLTFTSGLRLSVILHDLRSEFWWRLEGFICTNSASCM